MTDALHPLPAKGTLEAVLVDMLDILALEVVIRAQLAGTGPRPPQVPLEHVHAARRYRDWLDICHFRRGRLAS